MTLPVQNTPIRAITYAYRDAGIIDRADDPNSDQIVDGMNRLNDMILAWTLNTSLKLWLNSDQSITLVAGTRDYTLGPGGSIITTKPMRVIDGYYLNSSNILRPLYPLSWYDWIHLSDRTQQGEVTQYFVDKQQANLVVSFWLIPDATAATGTAHLLIQQQVANFTGITDTMNFPLEWFIALRWGLAEEISTGQPAAIMQKCATKAAYYKDLLEGWDVEDTSTQFQPDTMRGAGGGRMFR